MNTLIEETKTELLNFINSQLQKGVPVSAMWLIVNNMNNQLKDVVSQTVQMEAEQAKKQQEEKETPEEE